MSYKKERQMLVFTSPDEETKARKQIVPSTLYSIADTNQPVGPVSIKVRAGGQRPKTTGLRARFATNLSCSVPSVRAFT